MQGNLCFVNVVLDYLVRGIEGLGLQTAEGEYCTHQKQANRINQFATVAATERFASVEIPAVTLTATQVL
jgi:hypothetical protein